MRRERLIAALLISVLSSLLWCGSAAGGSTDADGVYTVTVTLVEASSDGGATYTTLFSGSQDINIAAVNAGAVAAGLVSGVEIPVGTYNRVRVTIGATLLGKGYVNSGGNTFYTSGGVNGTSSIAGNDNTTASDYTTSTYTIPEANRVSTQTVSIPIEKDKPTTIRVNFDTRGVFSLNGSTVVPGEPSVSVTTG